MVKDKGSELKWSWSIFVTLTRHYLRRTEKTTKKMGVCRERTFDMIPQRSSVIAV
jgi:hypothetical protein